MGRMPRPCATTAPASWRKTQNSQKSIDKLAGSLLYIAVLCIWLSDRRLDGTQPANQFVEPHRRNPEITGRHKSRQSYCFLFKGSLKTL